MAIDFTTEFTGDALADTNTDYSIIPDSIFDGRLDSRGDEDWIRVEFEADRKYDIFLSGQGDDRLEGGWDADELSGGPGDDTASYEGSGDYMGVEVRLYDGTARGEEAEGDSFVGMKTIEHVDAGGDTRMVEVPDIENLSGSSGNDILAGAGNDQI